jgi:hypothetical protein
MRGFAVEWDTRHSTEKGHIEEFFDLLRLGKGVVKEVQQKCRAQSQSKGQHQS